MHKKYLSSNAPGYLYFQHNLTSLNKTLCTQHNKSPKERKIQKKRSFSQLINMYNDEEEELIKEIQFLNVEIKEQREHKQMVEHRNLQLQQTIFELKEKQNALYLIQQCSKDNQLYKQSTMKTNLENELKYLDNQLSNMQKSNNYNEQQQYTMKILLDMKEQLKRLIQIESKFKNNQLYLEHDLQWLRNLNINRLTGQNLQIEEQIISKKKSEKLKISIQNELQIELETEKKRQDHLKILVNRVIDEYNQVHSNASNIEDFKKLELQRQKAQIQRKAQKSIQLNVDQLNEKQEKLHQDIYDLQNVLKQLQMQDQMKVTPELQQILDKFVIQYKKDETFASPKINRFKARYTMTQIIQPNQDFNFREEQHAITDDQISEQSSTFLKRQFELQNNNDSKLNNIQQSSNLVSSVQFLDIQLLCIQIQIHLIQSRIPPQEFLEKFILPYYSISQIQDILMELNVPIVSYEKMLLVSRYIIEDNQREHFYLDLSLSEKQVRVVSILRHIIGNYVLITYEEESKNMELISKQFEIKAYKIQDLMKQVRIEIQKDIEFITFTQFIRCAKQSGIKLSQLQYQIVMQKVFEIEPDPEEMNSANIMRFFLSQQKIKF